MPAEISPHTFAIGPRSREAKRAPDFRRYTFRPEGSSRALVHIGLEIAARIFGAGASRLGRRLPDLATPPQP